MSGTRASLLLAVGLSWAACDAAPTPAAGDAEPADEPATRAEDPKAVAIAPDPPTTASDVEPPANPDAASDGDAPTDADDAADELPPVRPEHFGEIRPPVPPPPAEQLTVHGLAGFEVVAIHSRPNLESARLGYLRFGQRVMVTPSIKDEGEGCPKGFHALGTGGFVCASKGFQVSPDEPPYMYMPPPPARTDDPIPYDYGVVAKDGTPLWWKMPDAEEVELANERYAAIVAAQAPPEPADGDGDGDDDGDGDRAKRRQKRSDARDDGDTSRDGDDAPSADRGDLPDVDDAEPKPEPKPEPTPEELAAQRAREAEAKKRAEQRAEEDRERAQQRARKAARLPLNSKSPFLESGFVITLGEKVRGEGRSWWRTTRGAFVESRLVWRKPTRDFHGGEIPPGTTSFGFVMEEEGTAGSAMSPKGKLAWKRKLEFRELLVFTGEVEIAGRTYLVTADGIHVVASQVRLAELVKRPAEVRDYERWIDVDLERQLLVAYEGDVPVYATLVSTGKKGTEEESFLTPTGKFRITTKHISSSMDGNTASDGTYSIQDVPWAMFFHGNFALHGAFWHSKFGSRRSHGCVNLGPTDAKWLFSWTMPFLPATWHGVSAHAGAPGSMVVIR